MTKCIVLGKTKSEKSIEFTSCVNTINKYFESVATEPKDWENIELILRHSIIDVMFAYDTDRSEGCIYLGHWNDGIV